MHHEEYLLVLVSSEIGLQPLEVLEVVVGLVRGQRQTPSPHVTQLLTHGPKNYPLNNLGIFFC